MSYEIRGSYGTIFYVADRNETLKFFKDRVGFKVKMESPEWTEFDMGDQALYFHPVEKNVPALGQGVLIVKVKGRPECVAELREKGVEFVTDMTEVYPGVHTIKFKDPSGNVLSFYEDSNH